jgi:hypothetical protein
MIDYLGSLRIICLNQIGWVERIQHNTSASPLYSVGLIRESTLQKRVKLNNFRIHNQDKLEKH